MTNDEDSQTKSGIESRLCTYMGNPWIGMFIKTTDDITMLPFDSMNKLDRKIEDNLKTKIVKTTVANSNLIGIYTAINSNGIILPNLSTEKEIQEFKKNGFNVYVSQEKNNAHGNNIAVNDKAGIINPNVSAIERRKIGEALDVELVPMNIAGFNTVGSSCVATNKGFLVHYAANEKEMDEIGSILGVKGHKGTVNMGVGFVSLGVIVNKNNYIAGEKTTAYEMGRIEEALDLIR